MKHLHFLFFVFVILQGCAGSGVFDRMEKLDSYLVEQNYGQALKLIEDTPTEHPQILELEEKRETIQELLRSYEKETIALALKQERAGEWFAVREGFKEAIEKSGHSQHLEDAQRAMLLRFQQKVDALELEELIARGKYLQKSLPSLEELHRIDPESETIEQRYSRVQAETEEVACLLLQHGKSMLEGKKNAMARRIFSLVVELAPTPEAIEALERLTSQRTAKTLKNKKSSRDDARKKDKKSIELFNEAMARGDLSEARRYLSSLSPLMQKSMTTALMRERLARSIKEYVDETLAAGDSLYRAGKYEQAMKVWQDILEIEPDNETVQRKVERARVVVEKVNILRKRQAGD